MVNAARACRSQHDIVRVQARESCPYTLGSLDKATTYIVAVVALAGSNAVAGYHLHSRHRCGTAGVAHALLGLAGMAFRTRPESAVVFA